MDYINLNNICKKINEHINGFFGCTSTIGIGAIVKSVNNICDSYKTAKKAITQRLLKGDNQVIHIENNDDVSGKHSIIVEFETEHNMLVYFEKLDMESVLDLIKKCPDHDTRF